MLFRELWRTPYTTGHGEIRDAPTDAATACFSRHWKEKSLALMVTGRIRGSIVLTFT